MPEFTVELNVYDLHWSNQYTFPVGLGVYHSGIVVHGTEYAYGGHPYKSSGIFDMFPKSADVLGPEFTFRQTVHIGTTELLSDEVEKISEDLGRMYTGASYHLIEKNCNHFTAEFSQILCSKNIPSWVNRLASVGSTFPFLLKFLPDEWISPLPESQPTSPLFSQGPFRDQFSGSEHDETSPGRKYKPS